MKILISIIALTTFTLYCYFIQPLFKTNTDLLSGYTTILGAIIGASGSILGGIIGGIITGIVAFKIAQFEFKKHSEHIETEKAKKNIRFQELILEEIVMNNTALKKLDEASSTTDIETTLKYSLSDAIYHSIKSELETDEFLVKIIKYYRILNRLITDQTIHTEEEFELIDQEMKALIEIEEYLKSNSATTKRNH